ncbi:MAG: response regulator [Spirochaetales bacterium]|uniref:Sensory/regulatory protein RpfC n=1 Tax=Candidatus Thalassospirochaeta sargassi TaxID=3119039 RepID=A0AAJ1IEH1_9SPIO|nr:response regulator [Spirochaetales bacterium]
MDKTEKLFRTIFLDSSLGMLLFKSDGEIHMGNSEVCRIFRCPEEKIESTNLKDFVYKDDLERFMTELAGLPKNSSEKIKIQARFMKTTDRLGWCRFNISEISYDDGCSEYMLALVEDITSQILLERQLTKAKLVAERATRTKSEFLANMSHEIRTPIHTIIGMSELLKETNLDAEQKEYAGQVEFSAEVLLSLINDILDVEKIEAGKLKLEEIEMDLLGVAYSAVDLVALQAHKKNLEAALYIEPDVNHLVYGDPTRLRQIIVNLFNNAMKFTSEGEIELKISSVEEDDEEVCLLFRVRDTGIGIPKTKMDKLFKEFSQVDSSTTRKYGGTGLGLTISKNLTRLMRGEIGVESTEGEGSTFWFTARFRKQHKESPYRSFREKYHDQRVLIVDDNPTAREILSLYLSELGFSVSETDDGRKALAMIEEEAHSELPYNSCVIDQIMPGMDGWYLASEINSLREQSDLQAIKDLKLYLVSPAGRSADEAKMKLLNWFEGYLNKPLKKNQLYSVFAGMSSNDNDDEPTELLPVDDAEDGKIRALVAEDHEVNQHLFKSILENMGCEVALAANGLEAVARCEESAPDIIFMDCQMPEMNGYEATEEIRRKGFIMPIVAVTASAIKGERDKCMACGMTDFLTKPFKKKDIQPVLIKWKGLNHDGSRAAESAPVEDVYVEEVEAEEVEELEEIEEIEEIEMLDIFNFEDAVETFLGNEETVRKLIGSYFEKVETQLPAIDAALSSGDTGECRELAHSIKGSALNLSMNALGDAAKELEYSSRDGEIEKSKENYIRVKKTFEELKKYSAEHGYI